MTGLRARMGAGYSQMNDLTIIQTTQVRSSTEHTEMTMVLPSSFLTQLRLSGPYMHL